MNTVFRVPQILGEGTSGVRPKIFSQYSVSSKYRYGWEGTPCLAETGRASPTFATLYL